MLEDDQALIDAIAAGSREAFTSVYRTHKDRLLTAIVYLLRGDQAVGEDVLHDVLMRLIEQAPTLKLRTSLEKYLLSCCLNRARDHLRRQTVHRNALGHSKQQANSDVPPTAESDAQEQQTRTMHLIAKLPDEQREVVTLHIHGDMTFQEIAEAIGISVNTAKSRYRYALNKLRESWPAIHVDAGDE